MLDTLHEDESTITSARTIVEHSTEFFRAWHEKKDISYGFHAPDADSAQLINDWDFFQASHVSTGIPPDCLRPIWDALRSPQATLAGSPKTAAFHSLLDSPPSLAEFRRALRSSKTRSSAGMSGVTYNLMSIWPDKTVFQVYDILCAIWKHKSTPPFWKWRWLVPIPKKPDNHTLANLRPISLIEVSKSYG
jgi:hypothetical protein